MMFTHLTLVKKHREITIENISYFFKHQPEIKTRKRAY